MATRKPAQRRSTRGGKAPASDPLAPVRQAVNTVLRFRLMRTGLLLVGFLLFWTLFNYDSIQELSRISDESQRLHDRVLTLQQENDQMTRLRDALAAPDNRQSIERLAREEELMTYPGEVLVHINRPE